MLIGAKDGIDKALVNQYAKAKTTNFEEPKIDPEDMWQKINMIAMSHKMNINLQMQTKVS